MKPVSKEILKDGTIIITVEKSYLFGLIKDRTTFSSNRIIVGDYREWVEEPDKINVPESLSLQLDTWNRTFKDINYEN